MHQIPKKVEPIEVPKAGWVDVGALNAREFGVWDGD